MCDIERQRGLCVYVRRQEKHTDSVLPSAFLRAKPRGQKHGSFVGASPTRPVAPYDSGWRALCVQRLPSASSLRLAASLGCTVVFTAGGAEGLKSERRTAGQRRERLDPDDQDVRRRHRNPSHPDGELLHVVVPVVQDAGAGVGR